MHLHHALFSQEHNKRKGTIPSRKAINWVSQQAQEKVLFQSLLPLGLLRSLPLTTFKKIEKQQKSNTALFWLSNFQICAQNNHYKQFMTATRTFLSDTYIYKAFGNYIYLPYCLSHVNILYTFSFSQPLSASQWHNADNDELVWNCEKENGASVQWNIGTQHIYIFFLINYLSYSAKVMKQPPVQQYRA